MLLRVDRRTDARRSPRMLGYLWSSPCLLVPPFPVLGSSRPFIAPATSAGLRSSSSLVRPPSPRSLLDVALFSSGTSRSLHRLLALFRGVLGLLLVLVLAHGVSSRRGASDSRTVCPLKPDPERRGAAGPRDFRGRRRRARPATASRRVRRVVLRARPAPARRTRRRSRDGSSPACSPRPGPSARQVARSPGTRSSRAASSASSSASSSRRSRASKSRRRWSPAGPFGSAGTSIALTQVRPSDRRRKTTIPSVIAPIPSLR